MHYEVFLSKPDRLNNLKYRFQFLTIRVFCPFSILITLFREEGAGLCAYRAFVC